MIDTDRRTITLPDGRVVRPSRKVFEVCACLARHPGHVKSRAELMEAAGNTHCDTDRVIDTTVRRARRLGVTQIHASVGVGYYWEE